MKDTLEGLRHKIERATELGAVVRSMKALSASSIHQYEQAVQALEDYYRTVELGLYICFVREQGRLKPAGRRPDKIGIIVFGSGQGLVGQFNDILSRYVSSQVEQLPGVSRVWAVGESIATRLTDAGLTPANVYEVPHSVQAITPMIGTLLQDIETALEAGAVSSVFLYLNRPQHGGSYTPVGQRFIPLDEIWLETFSSIQWPTKQIPETIFSLEGSLKSLLQEYFFITMFRACAESLASENASRLAAMQRAEKNIRDLLESMNLSYHQLRQSTIDEELFDVLAGAEAMTRKK